MRATRADCLFSLANLNKWQPLADLLCRHCTDRSRSADWGVDHISVDNCGAPYGHAQSVVEYAKFHDALLKVGKPMVWAYSSTVVLALAELASMP